MNGLKLYHAFFLFLFTLSFGQLSAQQNGGGSAKSGDASHRIALDDFPSGMVLNHIDGWGGMTVAVNEIPAGSDFGPLLEGLKNNSCQVPHWGYVMKGILRLTYDDGREEVLGTGDLFYMSPGHVAVVEEDLKLMDFSPQKSMTKLISHIEKKVAESQK